MRRSLSFERTVGLATGFWALGAESETAAVAAGGGVLGSIWATTVRVLESVLVAIRSRCCNRETGGSTIGTAIEGEVCWGQNDGAEVLSTKAGFVADGCCGGVVSFGSEGAGAVKGSGLALRLSF